MGCGVHEHDQHVQMGFLAMAIMHATPAGERGPVHPRTNAKSRAADGDRRTRGTGDRNQLFTLALGTSWVVCVGLPLVISIWLRRPFGGVPLFGVLIWFLLLRLARRISPTAHCDRLIARGDYTQAEAICERELALEGPSAWRGNRRIAWLNRRSNALLGTGRLSEALTSAMEALSTRPDAETLAIGAQCLLWLNRYEEAGQLARLALTLTRERSINALSVLATVLISQGQPAEGKALAIAGLSDISALLPFVQPAHHVALMASLCRAERSLNETAHTRARLRTMRRLARHNAMLRALALMEEADSFAPAEGAEREQVFGAVEQAIWLAPHVVCWYLAQPYTLYEVREDLRYPHLAGRARAEWLRVAARGTAAPDQGAPPKAFVVMELAIAADKGYARPAAHASRRALAAQGITLACTLLLLVLWTWQFFLAGS